MSKLDILRFTRFFPTHNQRVQRHFVRSVAETGLYDAGALSVIGAEVSFVDPISKRNRHARQAILFVQLQLQL